MSNIHSLPDLPVELQGSILQFIALVSPGNYRIQLMLLSKVVYDWSVPPFLTWVASLVQSQPTVFRVSYIQYDTVIIKDPKSFQSFLKVIESRDIAFLSARMRALFIKVYDDATLPLWTVLWKNILPYLSEMQYLEIWDPFLHYSTEELQPVRSAVVPVLQLLPRLSYLGIHPHFFWRSSEISYVVLHSITHLKIFDTGTSLSSILSSLNSFPSLTHFMFPLEELETSETAVGSWRTI
ncbi:hypothetical protein DL96DRAFT_1706034 [Flagelloscypha sp. PMI_526]|nr:hypothetical protein DL96DRAFT_1706034 [Flagelloscypha sp. PMI_526]